MGARVTEHRNAHLDTNNMHEVKNFPSAAVGSSTRKSINGQSEFLRDARRPNSIATIDGHSAPTTEVEGDIYTITTPELDIDGIVWQSGTTVRFTFSAGYDNTLYSVNSFLQINGADFSGHDGVHVITVVNASYLEVTIDAIIDGTDDDAAGSPALGYVSHQDYDPESLSNSQSIPRVGQVRFYGNSDLWFGNLFQTGDEYFDIATDGVKLVTSSGELPSGFDASVKIEFEMGDWDMDATGSITVAHGLSATEWKTIRQVSAIIRNDADNSMFEVGNSPSAADAYISLIRITGISLIRTASGGFDNTNYDSTSFNRGWVTFFYTPD